MAKASSMPGTPMPAAPRGPATAADMIKDTTTQAFMRDVIEASRDVPVLVDFWAPWCGPCKQLTPILEKVVRGFKGAVRLVKMNIDEHPQIAGQLGVQSIPAVFAFKGGRPIDAFQGALPESQVKTFIQRLVGEDAVDEIGEVLKSAEQALAEGDFQGAAEIYSAILGEEKENIEALAGLANCYIAAGDLDNAEATLQKVPVAKQNASVVAGARAKLELARKTPGKAEQTRLEGELAANPNAHEARYELALALNASGNREAALEHLLEIQRRNSAWNEEAARKQLVQLFDAWGTKDPLTLKGRKQLSILLFS